jgi:hypothetical protein
MKPIDWIIDNWEKVSKLVKENPDGFTAKVTEIIPKPKTLAYNSKVRIELIKGKENEQRYVVAYDTVARVTGKIVTFCSKNVIDEDKNEFLIGGYKEGDTYYVELVVRFWRLSMAQDAGVYYKQKYIYDLREEQIIPVWQYPTSEQQTYLYLIQKRDAKEDEVNWAKREGDQKAFDKEFWKLKALNKRVNLAKVELMRIGKWD